MNTKTINSWGRLRRSLGLSLQDMAWLADLSAGTIWRREQGRGGIRRLAPDLAAKQERLSRLQARMLTVNPDRARLLGAHFRARVHAHGIKAARAAVYAALQIPY